MSGCEASEDVKKIIRAMAAAKVEEGVTNAHDIVDAIHEAINEHTPLWKNEIADIISGYGKKPVASKGTKTDLQTRIQRLKKDLRDAYHPKAAPKSPQERQNAMRQNQIKKQIADLQDRIARKDFDKPETSKPQYDETTKALQRQLDRLRSKADYEIAKLDYQNSSLPSKIAQQTLGTFRAILLSNPLTLAKLGGAAMWHMVFSPIEDIAGMGLSNIPGIRDISAESPLHNDMATLRGIREGYARTFSKQTLKDMWQVLSTGENDLQAKMKDHMYDPNPMSRFVGNLHNTMKTPAENYAFTRSLVHTTEHFRAQMLKKGASPDEINAALQSDSVQAALQLNAYEEVRRAKLQAKDKESVTRSFADAVYKFGNDSPVGPILKFAKDIELPIRTVPVNDFSQASSYAFGLSKAILGILKANRKGMTPELADYIMRNFKKGSIGKVLLAIGILGASSIVGLYNPDSRKKEKGEYGSVKVGDETIPSRALHAPGWDYIFAAATAAHVFENEVAYAKKKAERAGHTMTKSEERRMYAEAATTGALQAGKAEAYALPMIQGPMEAWEAIKDATGVEGFLGKTASEFVPQVVKYAAQKEDSEQALKRKPTGFMQQIEVGIPGLRENVPLQDMHKMTIDQLLDAYGKMDTKEREKTGIADLIQEKAARSRTITPEQQRQVDAIQ